MKTQVHDLCGVMLQTTFEERGARRTLYVSSIRVLDGDYKPCGPNLVAMLDKMLCPTSKDADGTLELTPAISLLTGEMRHGSIKARR